MATHKPLRLRFLWLFILAALLLAACSATATPPAATAAAKATTAPEEGYPGAAESGYPANQPTLGYPFPSDAQSSYPAPEGASTAQETQVYPTITVMPELGRVEGIVLRNGKPVVNVVMYVSEVIKNAEGTNVSVKFDRTSGLNAVTDSSGKFIIPNIPDGDYGLVLDAVVNTLLLSDPKSSEQIILTIKSGSSIDLGTLDYDELPIP